MPCLITSLFFPWCLINNYRKNLITSTFCLLNARLQNHYTDAEELFVKQILLLLLAVNSDVIKRKKKESQSFAKNGDVSVPKTTRKIKLSSESYHMTIRTTGKSTRPLCNLLIHRCYGNFFYSTKKFSKYSCLFRVLNGPKILINSTSFFG